MKLEKIKFIVSIIAFAIIIFVDIFIKKSSDEIFDEFLSEYYNCVVIEKNIDFFYNKGLYFYNGKQINMKNKPIRIAVNSTLFHDIILEGDTVEKIRNTGTLIIKKKHLVLKFKVIRNEFDSIDTLKIYK